MRILILIAAATGLLRAQYTVTPIAPNGYASSINSYGQVAGSSDNRAFLWTPASPNAAVGSLVDLGGVPVPGAPISAAVAVNDRGQVAGSTSISGDFSTRQAFLWQPDTPNATTGTIDLFMGAAVKGAQIYPAAMNNYGQIVGQKNILNGGPFLWTPSSPNATTGTTVIDSGFVPSYFSSINDYGQVAAYSLFTPSTPNGTAGVFTALPLTAYAMNRAGVIAGPGAIWTPSSPNGLAGTVTNIPAPSGIVNIYSTGINSSGQVVGYMSPSSGANTPFLYSGGMVTDLGAIDHRLSGASSVGINDSGQIVVTASQTVYLLTPFQTTPPQPGEAPITIASNVSGQAFTVSGTGCHPGGYVTPQTLGWLPGSNCTVSFVSPHSSQLGTRYLFDSWQDGPRTNPRSFTAPAQATTYTGNFIPQYFVTTFVNIPGAGTVSGGGWYYSGTNVTVSATAASGYHLVDWSGIPGNATGANSLQLNVMSPITLTANFAAGLPAAPGAYTVTQIANSSGVVSYGKPLNNYGQVVIFHERSGPSSVWTPVTANSTAGALVGLPSSVSGLDINDYGEVLGFGPGGLAAWIPDWPNAATGRLYSVAGPSSSNTTSMNNLGQIAGGVGVDFIWTPSPPNSANGAFETAVGLAGLTRDINDSGQVISGSSSNLLLYNLATNSSTIIPNLGSPIAINNSGTILASACDSYGSGCTAVGAYLWKTGVTTTLPVPAGFQSTRPYALNSAADVVGVLVNTDGTVVPFLYTGGAIYDLSAVNSQLVGGIPVGINDHGQIVVVTGGLQFSVNSNVFLRTPAGPSPTTLTPSSGAGFNPTLTATFTDSKGWQDLDVVNVLINSALDGRNACYLAYSRPLNTLHLVNDAGTALVSASTGNSQCIVPNFTASGSGNTLTLVLSLNFTPAFAGNQIVYLAARDVAQDNSGWQPMGVWTVGPGSPALSVSPAQGSNSVQTFTFTFTDPKSSSDLGVVNILINNVLDGRQACYLAYSNPLGVLYLVNDAGTGLLPASAGNSQCSATVASASGSGNTLTLTLNVTFTPQFSGNRVVYLASRDVNDQNNSGWQALGVWRVP
jgi:probable HAF family extracellular repeat protein